METSDRAIARSGDRVMWIGTSRDRVIERSRDVDRSITRSLDHAIALVIPA
jgi:hypothetical protein